MDFSHVAFYKACALAEQFPKPTHGEVIVCGRSNVGKSSLINMIVQRKNLAHTSQTPGKTALITFYTLDDIYLVDLPGYGFARTSNSERARLERLIANYFADTRSFNLILALIDIRHPAQEQDLRMIDFLKERSLPFLVVATKADKLSKAQQTRRITELSHQLGLAKEAFIATSAKTKQGRDELVEAIEQAT